MKPHALYISSRRPWPPVSGREHMICQTLEAISEDFDITYCLVGEAWKATELPPTIKDLVILPGPNIVEIFFNLCLRSDLSFQERIYLRRKNLEALERVRKQKGALLVVVDMVRMAPYLPDDDTISICDMDDLLSTRYRQLASFELNNYSLFGTHKEKPLFKALGFLARPMLKRILRQEASLIGSREVEVAKEVNLVLMVSPLEKAKLSRAAGEGAEVMAFPPSMKLPPEGQRVVKGPRPGDAVSLLFVGDMRTPANILAAQLLVNEILPGFAERVPNFSIRFVGKADASVSEMIGRNPHATHLGWVDDLAEIYAEADIVVCPFVTGTGVKLKVLQAMSYGKPIVTNSIGVEGIAGRAGTHYLVADDEQGIVEALVQVAHDGERRRNLGNAARELVANTHDPYKLKQDLRAQVRRFFRMLDDAA